MLRARTAENRSEYTPEFGRVVNIREINRPNSTDDIETSQTVDYMDEIATADANSPAVYNATCEALDAAGLNYHSDPLKITQAVFWWLKRNVEFVDTPGTSPFVDQTLISPTALLAMPEPIGDCPQFSMLAAAMLRCCCIRVAYVTIAANPDHPDQWSHVYNTVEVRPGQYMPFDSSHGPMPGSEYLQPFKRRVWASKYPGKCRTKENGAEMVRSFYGRASGGGMRNRTLRGTLRDVSCDQDGNCYDTTSGFQISGSYDELPTASTTGGVNLIPGTGDLMTGPNVGVNNPALQIDNSSNPPASNTGLLSTLLNDATSIGSQLLRTATTQKPYYITGANGQQVLYNPNTGTVQTGATLAGSISPTILLFGLLSIGALALTGKK